MQPATSKRPKMKTNKSTLLLLSTAAAAASIFAGRAADAPVGYTDTPMLPGGKWHVHDPDRPQPGVVTPGKSFSHEAPAPSDEVVLFDGKDLSKWRTGDSKPSGWKVENGAMVVPPRGTPNAADIWTKDE